MTRSEQIFPWLVMGSLAAHAAVGTLLALAPSGSGHRSRVQVYSVQIIEAPARPEARGLDLEAPLNSPALTDPLSPLKAPEAKMAPPALPSSPTKSTALPAPKPPPLDGDVRVSLKALPPTPAGATPRPARNAPPAPSTRSPETATPPDAITPNAPVRPMDRLKKKVDQLHFQVEPVARPEAESDEQENVLALRLFHNAVRERVQKNYSFPGSFSPALKARVRVVVDRDGVQRSLELVQSSGDSRFDSLVCLAAIRNSKLPPVPNSVTGDTVSLILTCSP